MVFTRCRDRPSAQNWPPFPQGPLEKSLQPRDKAPLDRPRTPHGSKAAPCVGRAGLGGSR